MPHSFRALAQEISENIQNKFWDRDADFLLETYPPKPDSGKYSFLWGYGAYCTMLATYVKNTRDAEYLPVLRHALERLELYRAKSEKYVYYNSLPDCFGGGEPYYDDNVWIALFLTDVYEILGDVEVLEKAQAVAEYIFSGKSGKIGGIRWKENDCITSHACSTAPAAVLGCKLYKATGDAKYLTQAVELYDWMYENLLDADGTVFDNISDFGKVDKSKYTYNTGTMIWCGALLYGITHERRYLSNAEQSADGAMKFFVKRGIKSKLALPSTPWFHVYWLQGLVALNEHTNRSEDLSVLESVLRSAAHNGRTKENLYYPEWSEADYTGGKYYHQGLDNFGTAECMALLIPYEETHRPVNCFLGSSVTYGSANAGRSFVDYLAESQVFPCIKEAVSGTTLCAATENSYVERLKKINKKTNIAHLIVQLSTNDVTLGMPVGEISKSFDADAFDCNTTIGAIEYIIAYARKTWNCAVTFFTNPPFNNKTYEKLIDKLYAIKNKWGIGIIDFYRFRNMPAPDGKAFAMYMSDAVHPNRAGYEWMSGVFGAYLQKTFDGAQPNIQANR